MKKVVIIGPESTGKSTLCKLLAQHFKTEWCPEYAREYLLKHGTQYSYEDLLTIAKGQLALEDQYSTLCKRDMGQGAGSREQGNNSLFFIDTDMYVMKVWSEYVFGKCDPFILNNIIERKYDLYLLCCNDLPWVKDELREYPDETPRKELYNIYRDILINQSTPWIEICGNYEERLNIAIDAVNKYCL